MIVVLTLLVILQTLLVTPQSDYCQLSADHTMCRYREGELGRACLASQQRGVTREQATEILNHHNRLRAAVATATTGRVKKMRRICWEMFEIIGRFSNIPGMVK